MYAMTTFVVFLIITTTRIDWLAF